ncbi:MAG: molybdopterin-dependent oxidoreductase [Proteobacteria bacterium]|nr:molybdopterin-dependent oxidoreductase [Pseudomonadota bacterium]
MKQIVRTHCGRMDHGGCTLDVEVEDGRVVRVTPDPNGALSQGHICPKARALPELLNHPRRLRRPLRRVGPRGSGQWETISWEEALAFAARGLNRVKAEHGARSVVFCQGAPKGLEHFILIRLANTFGSPNVVGPQNVCHMPREMAGVAVCGFFPVPDYDQPAGAVLVWGSNLTSTNEEGIINTRLLNRLKADPAPVIVVDPRRTELARRADLWLPLLPGTDLALAMGFLQVIFSEELYDRDFVNEYTHGFDELAASAREMPPEKAAEITGLPAADLVRAARIYGRARPGLIQWGNGIEQNVYNYDTARALISLMAVCGNLDAPGGNRAPSPPPVLSLRDFVRADLQPDRAKNMLSASHGPVPGFVVVPPEYVKQAIRTGQPYPVRAAYIQVSNPVLAWSDSNDTYEALKSLDFIVTTETFMSPTAALADLVLPAATQLEFNDLGHYGVNHGFVLARPKAVDPPAECRPNARIINDLARALGLGDLWWDDYEDMLGELLAPAGLSYADLAERGMLHSPVRYYKYREKGFRTPTGKVELALSRAERMGLDPAPRWAGPVFPPDPDYPLLLTGHKSRHFFCSDHRYIEGQVAREPDPAVELHPDTAAGASVANGDAVFVETRRGRIRVKARVTDCIRPGVLSVVHGWWKPDLGPENPASWQDTALNVLTSSQPLNRALGTPNLRAVPARVSRADPA